jgi:colanic acid biosynthesis glycosyl transferase WcaI
MRRIVFINRFFFPDHSANSQMLSDLAFHLAASGKKVGVITSRQRYADPAARLAARETVQGVEVHRVPTTRYGRSALSGRALDYLSFYVSASKAALELVDRGDILVAKTDPPLMSVVAQQVVRRRRGRLVNWLQDVYPEVATELGVRLLRGPIGRGFKSMRDSSLRAAVANVVLGDRMAQRIVACGVPPAQIRVIPNWGDDDVISPVAPDANPLRRQWGLQDKFVVGYSGNLGRAHEFETLLGAAEVLKAHRNIVFLFIGDGFHLEEVVRSVKQRGLTENFMFQPYQDRSLLKFSLSVPDIHWISLRPEVEGLIVPCKIYGVLAAGRPVISITSEDGEIARLVDQHQCGIVIKPGDSKGLADAVVGLARDRQHCARLGQLGRAALDAHFTRQHGFDHWTKLLEEIA